MLVKVTDHKGKERYVNAAYIKSVTPKGENMADIEVSGWATKTRVAQPAQVVAEVVNASLPSTFESLLASDAEQAAQMNQAATIAAIG